MLPATRNAGLSPDLKGQTRRKAGTQSHRSSDFGPGDSGVARAKNDGSPWFCRRKAVFVHPRGADRLPSRWPGASRCGGIACRHDREEAGMTVHRTASPLSMVLALTLSIAACSSGSGGAPPADPASPPGAGGSEQPPPTAGPQVVITSPDAAEIETTDDAMDLSGSASSDAGIAPVEWETDHGESGTATGTETWNIEGVPIALGTTTITVTVTDNAGATHSDSLVVRRESEGTGSATLSWEPPTERADGTALTDLAGY